MVCGYEYKLPDQLPRLGMGEGGSGGGGGDLEEVDAVNSNSIVLYERYSHHRRRRSVGASSTSSDDSDACRIVVPVSDGEMEADDRYLQNLGRKVSMIAAEASQAQASANGLQRGDRAGSGRAARRSLRKISPGTARRLSTVSNNNNSSDVLSPRNLAHDQHEQEQQYPAAGVVGGDVIRFDDDEYGDADSTDSREEEEFEGEGQRAAKWSDDPADDSEEENPRFMLRRRSTIRRPIRTKNRASVVSMQSVSTLSSEDGCNRNAQTPPPPPVTETATSCKDEEDNDVTITADDAGGAAASLNYIPEL